jgi:hypothetical protein
MLAPAEKLATGFSGDPFHRTELAALVAAVTKRLTL